MKKKRRKFVQSYKKRVSRRRWNKTPRGRYTEQRKRAIRRGFEWLFTFETWWQLWQESGQWENRGRKADKYCMARKNDRGPYSPENCVIALYSDNALASAVTAGHIPPERAPTVTDLSDVPF